MQYTHFTIEEREKIQELLWQKKSVRFIAQILSRSPSSISREINKNIPPEFRRYTPRLANEKALIKRKSRGRKDRLKNKSIRDYVVNHLKEKWSPEQIAGRIKIDLNEQISHEAIYQYIYAQIHRDGYGYLKPGHEDLRIYLRRRRKRRISKGSRRYQRIFKPLGKSIDERPKIVEKRIRIGDWEGDTVESKDHRPGVNTLLERKTGLYLITKLKSKTSSSTIEAMKTRFEFIPDKYKKTITLDNGPENKDWQSIEKEIGIDCYNANPYHSYERGSNENTNGLLRDYYPKGTDFGMISKEELRRVEYSLNTRPRKRLGFKTPLEMFSVALAG